MIGQNGSITYDNSFFQCYICMNNVKKPRMCPSCSKLACQSCLRKWIEDSKSQCPHCRKFLPLNGFADCQRFVNDIKHLISTMDSNQKTKQKCKQHKLQMTYYCEQCKQAICSDCGMFGIKHKGHSITHLTKIYQQNKNKILNQLARFDQKIQSYRKNGFFIKLQMQKLMIQIGQKKTFIEDYFLTLIERLQEQFRDKKAKLENQLEQNSHQIELLEAFRDQICHELEGKSQKQVITNSEQLIGQIHKLCEKQKNKQFQQQQYCFQTIQQIVPKYESFNYIMQKYLLNHQGITYSDPYNVNGIQWRLKIYPRGNGVAKDTHISVFLEMSKAYSNQNKYQYKIQLVNKINTKDTIIRQYSSKFDIGECWGYNQFVPLTQLENGFLDQEGCLHFNISVRNPTYKSLVRDQENYIKVLENKLKNNQQIPNLRNRQIISKLSKNAQNRKLQLKKTLLSSSNPSSSLTRNQQQLFNNQPQANNLQISSSNSYLQPNQQYFTTQIKRQIHYNQQQSNNSNLQNISSKMNSLSIDNIDNMAMLETDSIQEEYKVQGNNNNSIHLRRQR